MPKLKVWRGRYFIRGRAIPALVCAYNQKEAAALVRHSLYEFRQWWNLAPHPDDIETGLKHPGKMILQTTEFVWKEENEWHPPRRLL